MVEGKAQFGIRTIQGLNETVLFLRFSRGFESVGVGKRIEKYPEIQRSRAEKGMAKERLGGNTMVRVKRAWN